MSSSNSSDPRMLLPDWLRDGDTPLAPSSEPIAVAQPVAVAEIVEVIEAAPVVAESAPAAPVLPYSDRLSLDTRLDPGVLVSVEDLPSWLGGLERASIAPILDSSVVAAPVVAPVAVIEEPEPYEGVDAPEEGVIDVSINGWYMVAGAIGLLILLAAALRLYLS